jgi:hypothetical protein
LTSKNLKEGKVWYYLYKCETDGCEFKGKSVRAHFVLDAAYQFLENHLFTTESNYENFLAEAKELASQRHKTLTSDIMGLTNLVGEKNKEYERAKELLIQSPDLKSHYSLDDIKKEYDDLKKRLDGLREQRETTKTAVLTYKQYLELFQNLSVKLRETQDMALLDQILQKFFSNFTVKSTGRGNQQRCEITHKLNEPWNGFVNSGDFDCGRDKQLLLELFDYCIKNMESSQVLLGKLQISKSSQQKIVEGLLF